MKLPKPGRWAPWRSNWLALHLAFAYGLNKTALRSAFDVAPFKVLAPSLSGLLSPNNLRSERAELGLDFFVLVLVLDPFIQNYERIVIAARGKTPTARRWPLKKRNVRLWLILKST